MFTYLYTYVFAYIGMVTCLYVYALCMHVCIYVYKAAPMRLSRLILTCLYLGLSLNICVYTYAYRGVGVCM